MLLVYKISFKSNNYFEKKTKWNIRISRKATALFVQCHYLWILAINDTIWYDPIKIEANYWKSYLFWFFHLKYAFLRNPYRAQYNKACNSVFFFFKFKRWCRCYCLSIFSVTEKWAKFSTLSQGSSHFERNQFEREKKEWKIDAICYIWYPIVKNLSRSIESVLQYYSCWEGNWARFKHKYHNVFVYQNCTSI